MKRARRRTPVGFSRERPNLPVEAHLIFLQLPLLVEHPRHHLWSHKSSLGRVGIERKAATIGVTRMCLGYEAHSSHPVIKISLLPELFIYDNFCQASNVKIRVELIQRGLSADDRSLPPEGPHRRCECAGMGD